MTIAEQTLRFGLLSSLDIGLSPFDSPPFARPLTAHYSLALSSSASAPQLSRASRASRTATAAPRTRSPPRDASPLPTSFAAGEPLRASFAQTSHQGGAKLLTELHALANHARPHRVGSPGGLHGAQSAPSAFLLSGGIYEGALASVLPRARLRGAALRRQPPLRCHLALLAARFVWWGSAVWRGRPKRRGRERRGTGSR